MSDLRDPDPVSAPTSNTCIGKRSTQRDRQTFQMLSYYEGARLLLRRSMFEPGRLPPPHLAMPSSPSRCPAPNGPATHAQLLSRSLIRSHPPAHDVVIGPATDIEVAVRRTCASLGRLPGPSEERMVRVRQLQTLGRLCERGGGQSLSSMMLVHVPCSGRSEFSSLMHC